jgi:aryl-alcohol dehydrogenase-like predicted oxidoreductase
MSMTVNKTYDFGPFTVRRMGFGAMQLPGPGVWGPPADRDEALRVLRRAVELGVDHIDTAQFYGPDVANDLIREALHPYPAGLRIVTKVGGRRGEDRSWLAAISPAEIRASVEDNLRSLAVERLDLVNLRVIEADRGQFEAALGELVDLRAEGKIELIGLSNVGVEELEHAQALTEIACVQNHYNVLERAGEELVAATAERGQAFVPFFPLGSAFTGGPAKLAAHPVLRDVAARHDATPAQVALAWLLHAGDHVLLIPGTGSVTHLEENVAAAALELDAEDLAALENVVLQEEVR